MPLFTRILFLTGFLLSTALLVSGCGVQQHPVASGSVPQTVSPSAARDQKTQQYILKQREKARKTRRTHTAH